MATAFSSPRFDIIITGNGATPLAVGDLNVQKQFVATQAFSIVGISAFNIAAGASTLTVVNAGTTVTVTTDAAPVQGAGVVQAQSQVGPWAPVSIIGGSACDVADGATVTIQTGANTVTIVRLECVAWNGQGSGGRSVITIA